MAVLEEEEVLMRQVETGFHDRILCLGSQAMFGGCASQSQMAPTVSKYARMIIFITNIYIYIEIQ